MFIPKTALVFSRSAFAKKGKSKRFWLSTTPDQQTENSTLKEASPSTLEMCCQNKMALENQLNGVDINENANLSNQSNQSNQYDKSDQSASSAVDPELVSEDANASNINASGNSDNEVEVNKSANSSSDSDFSSDTENVDVSFDAVSVFEKMQRLHEIGKFEAVLNTFDDSIAVQKLLHTSAYNLVLSSLAYTTDVSTQLQAFEKMLINGIKPDMVSYAIICNNLLRNALDIEAKRREITPILGNASCSDALESVEEAYETLSVEEPIVLALTILNGALAAYENESCELNENLQLTVDCLFSICVDLKIAVPDFLKSVVSKTLPGLIEIQQNIQDAVSVFQCMPEINQTRVEWQKSMLQMYFKFDQVPGAIAFFAACNAPKLLLQPLLVGFVSKNLVGTARQWVQKSGADNETIALVINALGEREHHSNEHHGNEHHSNTIQQILPSAYKLYNRYLSSNDVNDSSEVRSSFIRLCVAADDPERLFMAIKESHLNDIGWDAVTVKVVLDYLVDLNEAILAADICSWQILKLVALLADSGITSYACQEITTNLVNKMMNADVFSLSVSLRLLPVAFTSNVLSNRILSMLAEAKPCELTLLLDKDLLNSSVYGLSKLMIKFRDEDREKLKPIFAKFVRQSIDDKVPLHSPDHGLLVLEALKSCDGNCCLVRAWKNQNPCEKSDAQAHKNSMIIHLFASNPYGLEKAMDLYKSQRELGQPVSSGALSTLLKACMLKQKTKSKNKNKSKNKKNSTSVPSSSSSSPEEDKEEQRAPSPPARTRSAEEDARSIVDEIYEITPKSTDSLDIFIIKTAKGYRELAEKAYQALKSEFNEYPTPVAYASLIDTSNNDEETIRLLRETEERGILTAGVYNSALVALSKGNQLHLTTQLLEEAKTYHFDILPSTYDRLVAMHVRAESPKTGFKLVKRLPILQKSLLHVHTFNILMDAFITLHDSRATLSVFSELKAVGTLANSKSYVLLMKSFLIDDKKHVPQVDRAENVLQIMRNSGTAITAECVATIVRARGVIAKDFTGACEFYEKLVKEEHVKPNISVFKALIDTFLANDQEASLLQVFEEMKRFKIPMDPEMEKLL